MSIAALVLLFGVMVSLAALPSACVALVVARSASLGVGNGVAVAAGIVLGDLVFVALALLGLSVVAETLGQGFLVVKYLGAAYLIGLGLSLLSKRPLGQVADGAGRGKGSLLTSFLAGFVVTLGDVKAILFYVSLLPLFIEAAALRPAEVLAIVVVTVVGVGGVKIGYAFAAGRIAALARGTRYDGVARRTAGGLMVGAGSYIIAKG